MNSFDQIIGYENIKEELKWYCDILKNPERYEKMGVCGPRGILLHGVPGVGKSLIAKSFIKESGLNAYTLRKNLPNGDFVKEIKSVFDKAMENAPSIVFLDDVDKFANCDYSHTDAEEYVTIQSCIDECKDKRVFVFSTANDKHFLPDSLLRPGRFDKVIEIGLPSKEESEKIIQFYLKDKKVDKDVDSKEIAGIIAGNSCAVLESVVNEAGILAAYRKKKKIQREDLVYACVRMIHGAPVAVDLGNKENASIVALHEAGHVVVAEVRSPGSVGAAYLGCESGHIQGFAVIKCKEDHNYNMESREFEILHILGGKAALEIIKGMQDIGCRSDLQEAFDTIRNMAVRTCTYGFEAFESEHLFPSENKRSQIEEIVVREADRYYKQSKKIIAENRLFVGAVMAALLEKRILTQKEIAVIKENLTE